MSPCLPRGMASVAWDISMPRNHRNVFHHVNDHRHNFCVTDCDMLGMTHVINSGRLMIKYTTHGLVQDCGISCALTMGHHTLASSDRGVDRVTTKTFSYLSLEYQGAMWWIV